MTKKKTKTRQRHFDLRVSEPLFEAAVKRMRERGSRTTSQYIRELIERDTRSAASEDKMAHLEKVVAANHNRLAGQIKGLAVANRATFALLDAAVKAILSYLPDAGPTGSELARSRGKDRYERVLRAAERSSSELIEKLAGNDDRV